MITLMFRNVIFALTSSRVELVLSCFSDFLMVLKYLHIEEMPPSAKITKACKAMKSLGYSANIVKPVLKELVKLYEKDWTLIEEDSYRVLVDAILESEEQKSLNNKLELPSAEDEIEENEPPLKRSKRSNHKRYSSTSNASIRNSRNDLENQPYVKQNTAESVSRKCQEDVELNAPCFSKYCQRSSSPVPLKVVEVAKETDFVSHDSSEKRIVTYERRSYTHLSKETSELKLHNEDDDDLECGKYLHEAAFENERLPLSYDLCHSPDSHTVILPGSSNEFFPNSGGNCSILPEMIYLDAEDTSSTQLLLPKDAYCIGNSSHLEGNNSKLMICRQSEVERNESDARESLKLDIASSSRGEVKVSLMVESSATSDFNVPSLEHVLKQVEEQCLKSYRIPRAGFSLLSLMKGVCECFLAAGTTSTHTEDVGPTNVGMYENLNSETGSAEGNDYQLSVCSNISHETIRNQSHFEVSPQIPRFFGSIQLDLSRCKIYLDLKLKGSTEMEKNIMELSRHMPSSSRMMIVQNSQNHYNRDITKGLEACEISLINEINEEQGPIFNYILQNVTYKDAFVRFSLARILEENCCFDCSGDCLSFEIPCVCAGKTEFEFAYTRGCLLKGKILDYFISMKRSREHDNLFYCQDCPLERCKGKILSGKCKGHAVRKFIKECWFKCGCSINCGNRVVQRGITAKLQVFRTPDQKGWGLRTLEDIPRGAFICEYVGEVITNRESFERSICGKLTHPVILDADWSSKVIKDEEALCLDATVYGNVARFINHRCCDANIVEAPVEVETPDHHYYHLAFFTTRKVNALEELTWDYGIDFNDDHPVKAFKCLCGSKFCRDRRSLSGRLNLGD